MNLTGSKEAAWEKEKSMDGMGIVVTEKISSQSRGPLTASLVVL
jgi:hypothetical protein